MPTNYTGRIIAILAVLFLAVFGLPFMPGIFPLERLFNHNLSWSQKLNLKPGIDMVGGTSLLYEIKAPEGSSANANLAEQVMTALKKRVDPQGVRNLIWRPQGATRLEIQMPLSGRSGDARAKREEFDQAQAALDATNARPNAVLDAVEHLKGDERARRLDELAMGSRTRQELFKKLADTWDQIQAASQRHDAAAQAAAETQYDQLKTQIDDTNLSVSELQQVLDVADPAQRTKQLEGMKNRFPDFPARQTAIDNFAKAYEAYQQVKNELDDSGDLKRLLKGSGVLEFHILVDDLNTPEAIAMRERLQKNGPRVQAGDTMKWVQADRPEEFGSIAQEYNGKFYVLVYATNDKQLVNSEGFAKWALEKASPGRDQYGKSQVEFLFDAQGGKYFSDLTAANKNRRLGIVLDDKLISAPNINSQIGRSGVITGGGDLGFSQDELNYLVSTLSAGSLPAQLADEPISERTVGPQLGADNLRAGLNSCIVGLAVVGLFLIVYYRLSGVVAFIAVALNVMLILGVMAWLNATFTLPGIAGIVLTIGASVDANVLIFERFREESHRGLSLRMALRNAYKGAQSAIIDSNATTVITSLVLCAIGSEEVRGFGITLLIGLISSLFTALYVTKTIFGILIDKFGVSKLTSFPQAHPKWEKLLHPDIDWMAKIPYFLAFSAVFMAIGLGSFFFYLQKGQMTDIEFAAGTSVQFELKQPMGIEEVRKAVAHKEDVLPSPSVYSVGEDKRTYEIITPNADSARVRDAILAAFQGQLNIEQPSTFDNAKDKLDDALAAGTIVPIKQDTTQVAGFTPRELGSYRGGAAIILRNLNPELSPNEIKTRISRQRLQVQVGDQATHGYKDFTVVADSGPNAPAHTAVVLAADPDIPFEKDEGKWTEEVAKPMWGLVNDAVTKEAKLQKVTTFDPSVAGDTRQTAFMALVVSLVLIMAYIWLRFGNLKFGTATVLAMIHDTLLAIGAIGFAHLLAQYVPPVANALLLEPFRLNMTLVAAILTIMSYSMIDTIVVFDRIRENRGKFGVLDRKIINDSVNQTLSRTLLTAGTTIATVAVMYIMGGPGIHGFAFVLLLGILVGTYSSIAIAAPILLLQRSAKTQPSRAGARPSRAVGQVSRA